MPLWNWVPVPIPDTPHASSSTLPPGGAALLPSGSASFDTANISLLSNASSSASCCLSHRARRAAVVAAPLRVGRHADRPPAEDGGGQWLDKHHKGGARQSPSSTAPTPTRGLSERRARVGEGAGAAAPAGPRLKHADFDAKCKNEQYYSCPCFKYNEGFCTHPGRSPAIGREHHIGCMLTP